MAKEFLNIHHQYHNLSIFKILAFFGFTFERGEKEYAIYGHEHYERLIIYLDQADEQHKVILHTGKEYTPLQLLDHFSTSLELYNDTFKEILENKLKTVNYNFSNNPNLVPVGKSTLFTALWRPRLPKKPDDKEGFFKHEAMDWQGNYYPCLLSKDPFNLFFAYSEYHAGSFFQWPFCYNINGIVNEKTADNTLVLTHSPSDLHFALENYSRLHSIMMINLCYSDNVVHDLSFTPGLQYILPVLSHAITDHLFGGQYYSALLYTISYLVNHVFDCPFSFSVYVEKNCAYLQFYFADQQAFSKLFSSINRAKSKLKASIFEKSPELTQDQARTLEHYTFHDGIILSIDNRKIVLSLGFLQVQILLDTLLEALPSQQVSIQYYTQ